MDWVRAATISKSPAFTIDKWVCFFSCENGMVPVAVLRALRTTSTMFAVGLFLHFSMCELSARYNDDGARRGRRILMIAHLNRGFALLLIAMAMLPVRA